MYTDKLAPGSIFPPVTTWTLNGKQTELARPRAPHDWKLIVVYRGAHCPICTRYLNELQTFVAEFSALGVDIEAVSADNATQLKHHLQTLDVEFPITYGLSIQHMQALGLYISVPRSAAETDHLFSEPGLFVVNDRRQLQVIEIANAPFIRPQLAIIARGIRYIRTPSHHYPIRGTYVG